MWTKRTLAIALAGTVLGISIYSLPTMAGQSRPARPATLNGVTSLRCFSGKGYSVTWDAGVPKFESARFPSEGDHIQFDAIDRTKGQARLIGNAGVSDVSVWETQKGLHFTERTGGGNLNVTTVFSLAPKGFAPGSFVFVASRHQDLGMREIGQSIIASQYHGICEAWE